MRKFRVVVNGITYEVEVEEVGTEKVVSKPAAAPVASVPERQEEVTTGPAKEAREPVKKQNIPPASPASPAVAGGTKVEAPMPGTILDIRVKIGDSVSTGDVLLILEAMKMENEITAPQSGTVKEIVVSKGASVNSGDVLVVLG